MFRSCWPTIRMCYAPSAGRGHEVTLASCRCEHSRCTMQATVGRPVLPPTPELLLLASRHCRFMGLTLEREIIRQSGNGAVGPTLLAALPSQSRTLPVDDVYVPWAAICECKSGRVFLCI